MWKNPKDQIPNSKKIPNSNLQIQRERTNGFPWDLELGIFLGFGIWDLVFSFPVLERRIMVQRRSGVDLARAVNAGIVRFHDFPVIGNPSGHATDSEHDRKHLDGNSNRPHDDPAVE